MTGLRTKTCRYEFDALGRKNKFVSPAGITNLYAYDAESRLIGIEIPGEGAIAYSVNQYGQLAGQTLPGGATRTYGYSKWTPRSESMSGIRKDEKGSYGFWERTLP